MLALECFSAGNWVFRCWHSGTLLISIDCFSTGALGGTLPLECFQGIGSMLALWHSSVLGSGIRALSNQGVNVICGVALGGMPGCLHKFRLYAAGAVFLFECQVSGIGNAKGCGIGSILMLLGAA